MLPKIILQDSMEGMRRRGRPRKSWKDNIREWTGPVDVITAPRCRALMGGHHSRAICQDTPTKLLALVVSKIFKQEGSSIGGAVRNVTSLIAQRLSYTILDITCSENAHALPFIDSHRRVDCDSSTTPVVYLMQSNHNQPTA